MGRLAGRQIERFCRLSSQPSGGPNHHHLLLFMAFWLWDVTFSDHGLVSNNQVKLKSKVSTISKNSNPLVHLMSFGIVEGLQGIKSHPWPFCTDGKSKQEKK